VSDLIYEAKVKMDTWLKVLFILIIAFPIIMSIIRISRNTEEGLVSLGAALFVFLLLRLLLPQRFQIFNDKLRIKLGGSFAFNIPLSDITDAKSRTGVKAFFFGGIRFATSAKHTIEIIRSKGMNIVISPENTDVFLEQLNQARQTA
jgi:hypothetical protein